MFIRVPHLQRILRHSVPPLMLVLVAVLVSACSGTGQNGTPAPFAQQPALPTATPIPTVAAVAPPTYLAQRGDVQQLLTFSGRWEPRDQTLLSFSVSGTVRRVNVRIGDTIRAGQLLADFQIDSLENQLAQAKLDLQTSQLNVNSGASGTTQTVANAEISLANAKLNLQKTKDSSPWTQVTSAKIQLDNANTSLAAAQRDYDDALSRPNQPASTMNSAYDRLISAQSSVRSAEASYFSAAQNFNNYKYQVQQAENQVIQAQMQLDQARTGGNTDPQRQQTVISAQLKVDQIQEQIDQSSLVAPIDAEVLAVSIKAGDAVKAFDAVITIGKSQPKEANATVAFADAQNLSIGLVGTCQVLNRPETAVQCVVRRIPRTARDADQSTRVAASLDDLKLATGQLIDISMPLKVAKNVLWLPPVAVRTFQNRNFVVLQTPDGPRRVDVQIGLRTDDRVEIQSGVKEGDVVVGP